MKETNEDFLKEQIGNLGGVNENVSQEAESLIGKKLRNIPGQKQELDKEEDAQLSAFLNRASSRSKIAQNAGDVVDFGPRISQGWMEVDRAELGIRSKFYPDDWAFYIRPATVEAIKNWSAIDEERIDILNNVFNDIVRSCVSIKAASGNIPWSKINSWDRFWFILKVRELTFKSGEAKIEFTDTCPECDEEILYKLDPKSLHYEFPDDDIVEKHWDTDSRAWIVDPAEYGINKPVLKFYIPTLEKDQAILDWGIAKARTNKKIDQTFIKFLPWMLNKIPKDEQVLERFISEAQTIYKNWDVETFNFADDVVRNITINPSENLRQVCPHCGEEVISNVRFPNGIRALFKTETKHAKFGSR